MLQHLYDHYPVVSLCSRVSRVLVHAVACKGPLSAPIAVSWHLACSSSDLNCVACTMSLDMVRKRLQVDGNSSGQSYLMALNRSYTSLLKKFEQCC